MRSDEPTPKLPHRVDRIVAMLKAGTDTDNTVPKTWVERVVESLSVTMVLLAVAWALDLPTYFGRAFFQQQFLALVLGFAVAIVFMSKTVRGQRSIAPPWYDVAAAAIFCGTMVFVSFNYPSFLVEIALRPTYLVVLSVIVLLGVLEALRRSTGWLLFAIIACFGIYALLAHLVPAPLTGRRMPIDALLVYLAFDTSAVLGMPLTVASTIVIIFILFGEVLFRTGGGLFFTDLAMALVGRKRGGAAKIAVVSSAFFGSITGSAVSNVATTGLVTVPIMRRAGYSPTQAGSIEAVASTGGQFMPPIMGAAAFLMAEFLVLDYTVIIIAALVPALLYYLAVFVQVHLIAERDQIAVIDDEMPELGATLKDGWHFIVPFALLIFFLFEWGMSAQRSALASAAVMLLLGMVKPYRGKRARLADCGSAFVKAGLGNVELVCIVAAAGMVIGVLNATGGGFALTLALVGMSGGALLPLLLIAGIICIILGMGMPTAGVYVLLATLVAPALVEGGVEPLAAHMFVLYFGMMSMITPPIALACFAAAALTKASPMATALSAVRLGWVAYIVPYLFVLSPTLLMFGDRVPIALSMMTAGFGVVLITIAVVGYYRFAHGMMLRTAFMIAGIATLTPAQAVPFGLLIDLVGAAFGVGLLLLCYSRAHDHGSADASIATSQFNTKEQS